MTMYNSYESAKINNPESQIYTNGVGGFTAKSNGVHCFPLQPCNPADHCITVEKFLADGHEFVEGDICLGQNDNLLVISGSRLVNGWNDESQIVDGIDRYILRAAALEEKLETESEYDKGMREAMKKIAVSCGRVFGSDVGYEDLPDLVDSLINPPEKKPRTEIEYVKVKSVFELNRQEMHSGKYGWKIDDSFHPCFNEVELISNLTRNDLFILIETEIDERQEFIDEALKLYACNANEMFGEMYDSGKFKLVEV